MEALPGLVVGLGLGLLGARVLGWWRPWPASRAGRLRRSRSAIPGEDQLRRWLESIPQGWLVVTPDRRIAWLTARAAQLLELGPDQGRPGQPLASLLPSDEVLHLIELCDDSQQSQRGTWRRGERNFELLVLGGNGGWLALVLEGRHQLEAQLAQQERWVSDVAHELKTPLTALMLVGDSLAAGAGGRQAVLVDRLQQELRRLQRLVGDLLDLSRLENTPVPEARGEAVEVAAVLESVWTVLQPLARERRIQLRLRCGEQDWALGCPLARVAVEPSRLHQALLNLLDNALRYSPDAAPIEVGLGLRDGWCRLSVRDHGPGLSDGDRQHLFERFYRGDPARVRGNRTGSGLGLAIVQQIAHAHGGLVRARNHPGGGAVLELLLPRC